MSLASWYGSLGERVAPIMAKSGERVQDNVKAVTPILTGRMREHTRLQPTEGGYGYFVGWVGEDFRAVGQPFYPYWVIFGTGPRAAARATTLLPKGVGKVRSTAKKGHKPRAGNPNVLVAPLEAERPRLLDALRKGLVR